MKVKGSNTTGTVTNVDGEFSLNGVQKGQTLVISYIGSDTQEVKWTGQTINIVLKNSSQSLNEVVIVGYGTQKKANLSGAVASVDGKVLENRPITNIGQGLQGVVPNLNVSVGSGALGQASSFNVRGNTSLNGGGLLCSLTTCRWIPTLLTPTTSSQSPY